MQPVFLTLADAVRIHVDQIERYGGRAGIRDIGLLQPALAMPEASFGGEWMHRDPYEMAAAYAFHISQDQPFVDGNKRTGLACALVFLELNGVSLSDPAGRLYQAMMDVAVGDADKWALADTFRALRA
ncbi:MAG: type II toxin-antitoxin system death-on-curing family toxin [Chloroflexi bacterium]|nr:type II toxin-antitoxin system death-on-curing family toxin [Chloroflexota bacterium]